MRAGEQVSTIPPATRRIRRFGFAEGLVLGATLMVSAAILGLSLRESETLEGDLARAHLSQDIQLRVALSNLALEQSLSGDTSIDVGEQVLGNIDAALTRCQAMLTGGQSEFGAVAPMTDDEQIRTTREMCGLTEDFRRLSELRLQQSSSPGGGLDTQGVYDRAFSAVMRSARTYQAEIQGALEDDQENMAWTGIALTLMTLVAGTTVALILGRQRRRLASKSVELSQLASIVSSSSDAIIGVSLDGLVTSWNRGAERLLGYPAADIVGQHIEVLIPPDGMAEERSRQATMVQRVVRGDRVDVYEADRLRMDGSTVPLSITLSPVMDAGAVVGISAIAQDITKRRTSQAQLETARREALESSRAKSEFLATMSHEIRTPLNGVIGLTSLLLETPLNRTQRQYAEGVQGAGEVLLRVINDILDFSKLEAGKVELEMAVFDPRRLVDEVVALSAPATHLKGLELIAYCQPGVPASLVGDAGRIRQILENLVSNAVKFTAAGEVVVEVSSVARDAGVAVVRFEVLDTGIGVSSSDSERLFESFSQADASTTRRFGGTGLGLAISRKLTEAMGGQIGVEGRGGAGSKFWFEVPLTVDAASQVAGPALDQIRLTGVRVLVVDDNATNRLVLESQLISWGMRPDVVEHPHTVMTLMHLAAAEGRPYAIAVLDMSMPDMDGLQLARLISADATLTGTRLIMLTSTMELNARDLKHAGVADWLPKPVRNSELYDRLVRLMAPTAVAPATSHTESVSASGTVTSLGRVLVVEDNEVNQLVAEAMLGSLGYQVDIVPDGAEALDAVSAIYYSAVFMDCHMPVMDGFTATEEIRRRESDSDRVPIIAMTAAAMSEDREHCLAVGMDDYISKPVTIAAIKDVLTRWVRSPPLPPP